MGSRSLHMLETLVAPSSIFVWDAGKAVLLDLHLGAGCFELLLDVFGLFLADVFLDRLGSAFDEILRLFQTESGDLADRLDDVDLVGAAVGEDDGKLRLLLGRSRRRRSATAA